MSSFEVRHKHSAPSVLEIIFRSEFDINILTPTIQEYLDNPSITTFKVIDRLKHDNHICAFLDKITNARNFVGLDINARYINSEIVNGLIRYISKNTVLVNLKLNSVSDLYPTGLEFLMDYLITNTTLRGVSFRSNTDTMYYVPLYNMIIQNSTINHLAVDGFKWNPRSITILSDALSKNNTLTHFGTCIKSRDVLAQLVNNIQSNTKLLNLVIYPEAQDPYIMKVTGNDTDGMMESQRKFLYRNTSLLWENVRKNLFEFAFIFHHLPAYVLLEIFDWLPLMCGINHYKKVQLIIAVKNSVQKNKN